MDLLRYGIWLCRCNDIPDVTIYHIKANPSANRTKNGQFNYVCVKAAWYTQPYKPSSQLLSFTLHKTQFARELDASNATCGWSIRHLLVKPHVCEVCKPCVCTVTGGRYNDKAIHHIEANPSANRTKNGQLNFVCVEAAWYRQPYKLFSQPLSFTLHKTYSPDVTSSQTHIWLKSLRVSNHLRQSFLSSRSIGYLTPKNRYFHSV